MQEAIEDGINNELDFKAEAGPDRLKELAERLAVWTTVNNNNEDGSKLREKGYTLAGAIMDWAHELYPESQD